MTNKEQKDIHKLQMLLNAVEKVKAEEEAEDAPNFEAELVEAGWNIVHENPGIECAEWMDLLVQQYPLEVVDALGNNPFVVFPTLEDWWEQKEYTDPETGDWNTLAGWSEYYATNPEYLQLRLDKANERIKTLETELKLCKVKINRLETLQNRKQ